jgi:predicted permease
MNALRAWFVRLGGLLGREQRDRELSAELESHLQIHIEENLRAGMTPEEARRQALIKLGGVEQTKENYRDRRGLPWLETLLQDIRFGLRMLRKNPGFTAVAVLTLALGIGANTAIFSVVDAVLLNPVPFPQPDRLVNFYESTRLAPKSVISYPNFLDWEREAHNFSGMAAWVGDEFTLTGTSEPERLLGERVSANFFSVLGVRPILGRTFRSEEDQLGGPPVVLIGEGLWKRRFGSDPGIIGKSIVLNDKADTVIGVIPADFRFVRFRDGSSSDVFTPLGQWDNSLLHNRQFRMALSGIGRLKPGVTVAQAREEMDEIAADLVKTYPKDDASVGIVVVPMKQDVAGDLRPALLVLLGSVGLVLLIACANVANLLPARSTERAQEFAIRAALGASRARLVRQSLVESVLLAATGGALGVVLASWGTRSVLDIFPSALPAVVQVNMNLTVLAVAVAASLLTGILFGLAPALRNSAMHLQGALKEGGRGATARRHRVQSIFVAAEVGLSLILLIAAGLLIRSFAQVWSVNPGFDPHNVLALAAVLSPPGTSNPEQIRSKLRELRDKVAAIPGVESASLDLGALPFSGNSEFPYWPHGQPPPSAITEWHWAIMFAVSPAYFQVMRIPLIRGRAFTDQDGHSAPTVILIDQDLAESIFPGQDPVGKPLDIGPDWTAEVVGVVGHVTQWGLDSEAAAPVHAQMYLPYEQLPDFYLPVAARGPGVVVRSSVAPLSLARSIQREIGDLDPNGVVYDPRTMEERISGSLAERRFVMTLLGAFAGIALLLATIGIYGVVSYLVGQRTHEIGIRMALGAQRRDIVRIVLSQGGGMALVGIVLGLVASLALTRLMRTMLFGVSPTDALTFASVVVILLAVVLLACWIPARRAMRVDPMVALRYE